MTPTQLLDDAIAGKGDKAEHPLIRFCRQRLAAGDSITLEVDREVAGFGDVRTSMAILRTDRNGHAQEPRVQDWDDDLAEDLLRLGIKSVDEDNESRRFALAIRASLRKIERRHGDGYTNLVLVELLDESDLCKSGPLAEVRPSVHANKPSHGGRWEECRESIAREIGACAENLRSKLGYDNEAVRRIMNKALAYFIAWRFSFHGHVRDALI